MSVSVLTGPQLTSLSRRELIETNNFLATIQDADLPAAIARGIQYGEQAEGTNRAASVLLTIEKIQDVVAVGGLSKALEAYGWHIGGRKESVEGADGQLHSSGEVVLSNFTVVCPRGPFVPTSIQSTFEGMNVGKVSLTFFRNVGKTAQKDFEFQLTNCRISFFMSTLAVAVFSFIYDTIKMIYYPIGDDGKASGQIAAGFDLTKNADVK